MISPMLLRCAALRCRLFVVCTAVLLSVSAPAAPACVSPGQWYDPATGRPLTADRVLSHATVASVVLLGEQHDRMDHHRWQLHTLAALHDRRPHMVIGFEMFPRRAQPALDRWVAGELEEHEFLEQSRWSEVWGMDPDHYLPLFHFARMHRIPMLALNVDHGLVQRIRDEGWDEVPREEREGVGRPAPASDAYRERLHSVYREHPRPETADETSRFDGFVDAQLLWDRAMAEVLHDHVTAQDTPLVVGIIGAGHLMHAHGVPHQLADLGVEDVMVLLPWGTEQDCAALRPGLADAVFGISGGGGPPAPPRLGIRLQGEADGLRVVDVNPDGVAAAAGLARDDLILTAAGRPMRRPGELVEILRRQSPGTWLPLTVRRGEEVLEIIARFPSDP